ncbi:NAD(P)H-dependent oxidoreductase [Microbacterium sp. Se5.02b]|uniref:NAD(P)H-dependent oxidoreductase n=1 Tax=Microbacterium sp. Se5.02b TaxID=2864103 RepID=UPI00215D6D32|nr:NAD(P)H-dependent oxidoreductase [Microbacterium sp. Se5.02b]
MLALRDLDFDPHLRFGYRERMTLEPDLVDAKQALHEADSIIVATPLWWGSVPALLKGFFDRALLPQQEYRYSKLGLPEGLLPARRGRLLLLADTPGSRCRSPGCRRRPRWSATRCACAV